MSSNKEQKAIEVKEEDLFRLFDVKRRNDLISKKALNNIIVPYRGFDESHLNDDLWNITKTEKYGNTYRLYIHSLRVVVELLLAFEDTKELSYFDKAEEIIFSWIKFSETDFDNDIVWYDHSTANRVQALIHYLYLAKQIGREINHVTFYNILLKHSEILSDDTTYRYNNHGLMVDRSLMILSYVLKNKSLLIKGKNRAIQTFWYSFSSQGVHLENSPQYHTMVVKMYTDIEKYLNQKNDSLGKHLNRILNLAKSYVPIVSKPGNILPSLGDTGASKTYRQKVFGNFFDIEAGIALLQYEQPFTFYMTFVAGYSTRVHKHKDDLSITLNYKGIDFIVDPGRYSYTKDKTREYITSKEAHSGFYLTDFDYTIKDLNRYDRKVRIDTFYDNYSYTFVKGTNHDYDGSNAKLSRIAIQFKRKPLVILVDRVLTFVKHGLKFEQSFNLDSKILIEKDQNMYRLKSTTESMVIKQFSSVDNTKIIYGDPNEPVAVNTSGFGSVENTTQLKFQNSTNELNVFVSAIYDDKIITDFHIDINNHKLVINLDDKKYEIDL